MAVLGLGEGEKINSGQLNIKSISAYALWNSFGVFVHAFGTIPNVYCCKINSTGVYNINKLSVCRKQSWKQ